MRVRGDLRLLAGSLLVSLACDARNAATGSAIDVPTPEASPNIIIYLVDTLRADHLSLYGYPRATSPQLEEFAGDAVRFDRAYSPSSWTRPAVGSLLTGLYPGDHGAVSRPDSLRPEARLLPEYLQERGYATAAIVTNPNVLPIWGFGRGFDEFVDVESTQQSGRADLVNREALKFLGNGPPQPFLLYIHTRDPHEPYDPPPPWDGRFHKPPSAAPIPDKMTAAVDAYDGEIGFNDHHFGELLDEVRRRGIYEGSLIVFTSDHGEQFGERGQQGHGHNLHEEAVRVPLVVKFPGNAAAGLSSIQIVSLLDLLPTLLAQAGIDTIAHLPGSDLAELLGRREPPASRPIFFELDLELDKARHLADGVLDGDRKLLRQLKPSGRTQLFDSAADEEETLDLAGSEPQRRDELLQLVDSHRAHSSSGLHFHIVHSRDRPRARCRAALSTDGAFASVRGGQLENQDRFELAGDRRTLEFIVEQVNYENPSGRSLLIDRDALTFDLEPSDAQLSLDRFECDGRPALACVGNEVTEVLAPARWAGRTESLSISPWRLSLNSGRLGSNANRCRAFVGEVSDPSAALSAADLDPALVERLRALGYLD